MNYDIDVYEDEDAHYNGQVPLFQSEDVPVKDLPGLLQLFEDNITTGLVEEDGSGTWTKDIFIALKRNVLE